MPSDALLDRVSRIIEANPERTKTSLSRLISGKRQDVLAAISELCSRGDVAVMPGERAPVLTSVRPYRRDPTQEPPQNRLVATRGEPTGNHRSVGQTTSVGVPKDGEVRATATGATNGSDPVPVCQPRCKVCKSPELLHRVNTMLANGFTIGAILSAISGHNAALAEKQRITDDSLHRHRHRHFPVQAGAASVWRQLMEARADAASATYQAGVANLVPPRIFFEVVVAKSFAGLVGDGAEVSIADGARAATELAKMTAVGDEQQRWAEVHAKQAKILAAFRLLPDPYQQQVLDAVDGRTAAPPPGGRRAVIGSGMASDDEFDPLDSDEDFEDDDED